MGKYYPPSSVSNELSEQLEQMRARLLEEVTMSQAIWPNAADVSDCSGNRSDPEPGPKGDDEQSQPMSSRKSLLGEYNFGTVDPAVVTMGRACNTDYLKKDASSKEKLNNSSNYAGKGNKKIIKYSREFLLSIKQAVKDKPFQGEIQYPCVLRTHIDPHPPRILRLSRSANGYPARINNNNNYGYGYGTQVYPTEPPPALLPITTPWWLPRQQPTSPPENGFINNNYREQQFNNEQRSVPSLFGISSVTTAPDRISRQPRLPELRTPGFAFPVSTIFKEVQPTTNATNENGVQNEKKLFQPHVLGIQQVLDHNAKRCIVPLKVINKP